MPTDEGVDGAIGVSFAHVADPTAAYRRLPPLLLLLVLLLVLLLRAEITDAEIADHRRAALQVQRIQLRVAAGDRRRVLGTAGPAQPVVARLCETHSVSLLRYR